MAKYKQSDEEKTYRIYVSDLLRFYATERGAELDRYYDYISGKTPENAKNEAISAKDKVLEEFRRLGGG